MDKKLKCPRCSQSNYSVNHQGGEQTTFLQCKSCGFKSVMKAWEKQQEDLNPMSFTNPFYKESIKSLGNESYYQFVLKPGQYVLLRVNEEDFQSYDFLDAEHGGSKWNKDDSSWEEPIDYDEDSLNSFFLTSDFPKWFLIDGFSRIIHILSDPLPNIVKVDVNTINNVNKDEYKKTWENGRDIEDNPLEQEYNEGDFDEERFSKNNPFYKKSNDKKHPYDEMYPEEGPWGDCECGQTYQDGINGFDGKCEACHQQEAIDERKKKQNKKTSSKNSFNKTSEGIAPDQKPASFYPSGTEKDPYPEKPGRNRMKKKRTELLESYDESQSTEEVRRVSNRSDKMNPFYKKSEDNLSQSESPLDDKMSDYLKNRRDKFNEKFENSGPIAIFEVKKIGERNSETIEIPFEEGSGIQNKIRAQNLLGKMKSSGEYEYVNLLSVVTKHNDGSIASETNDSDWERSLFSNSVNPFYRKVEALANGNPFYKQAREFGDRSEHGKKMKELSDDNMVFPEDPNHSHKKHSDGTKGEKTKKTPDGESSHNDELNPSYEYNTVDRKEMRSSPKPWDLEPGYKDWYDREVDKYYDGWLDDHIENSGGSVPGSNTEKTMNLNDKERAHTPEFPTEAIYEKLLENRHQFTDDYTTVVANGIKYTIKTSDAISILSAGGIEDVKKKLRKGQ